MSSSLDFLYLLPPDEQNAILNGPALAPPTIDIVPNFEHPPNKNLLARVVLALGLAFVTILIALRAYAKIFIARKLQIQDYLASLAYLSFVGACYSSFRIAAEIGFFVHQWDVLVRDVNALLLCFQIGINFYAAAMLFVKTSILLDWLHLFVPRGTRGAFFWTCHIVIWFNILFYFSILVAGNLSCRPFHRIWDKRIPGVCFDRAPVDLTSAGVNLVCDMVILLVPQRAIWQLQLTTSKKLGVSVIFAIGLLAVASAVGRLVATERYSTLPDFTYEVSKSALWCLAELSFAFSVLCIPSLPKIFKSSNVLGRLVKTMFSCSLHSKATEISTRRNLQVDDGGYHRMQSSQISLVNLPAKQTTYQISSALEPVHLHSASDNGLFIRQEGAVTLTKEFTARATHLSEPGEIESGSLYHTWDSNRDNRWNV
ncbi:hypothetical protein F4803DRAFT_527340 [Xylaria telfairii]|nr:hypothetical protein F4803DRAFT_527340 [Xylaria telfairii]